jgi:hypothetical protein
MTGEDQHKLRDDLLAVILPYIADRRVTIIEAAVAAMGACAAVCALLAPAAREVLVDALSNSLGPHADKRASEIRNGDFDRELARRHQ